MLIIYTKYDFIYNYYQQTFYVYFKYWNKFTYYSTLLNIKITLNRKNILYICKSKEN